MITFGVKYKQQMVLGGEYMILNRSKINIVLARKQMSITVLAKAYGVSRTRMHIILNSKDVTPVCAGRLAKAIGMDVEDIIEY